MRKRKSKSRTFLWHFATEIECKHDSTGLTKMIDSQVHLKAISSLGVRAKHYPSVINENMEFLLLCKKQQTSLNRETETKNRHEGGTSQPKKTTPV